MKLSINRLWTGFILLFSTLFFMLNILSFLSEPIVRQDFIFLKNHDFFWFLFVFAASAFLSLTLFLLFVISLKLDLRAKRHFLVPLILILAAAVRLIWVNMFEVLPKYDFELYYLFADHFARGDYVGQAYISVFPHTIGYSMILSFIYRLFGSSIYIAQMFNILLSCGTVILIYLIGKKAFNESAGILSSAIWAFWPSQIFYNSLVSTESLYTFMLLLCILIYTSLLKSSGNNLLKFIGLGALIAFSNAIRPLGLILVIAFTLTYLIKNYNGIKDFIKRSALPTGALILSYLIFFNLISMGISEIIDKEVARSPLGFNLYVGSNIKYMGRWNSEDSKVLSEPMQKPDFNAQQLQNKLADMAIKRFMDQGWSNLELFHNKYTAMWSSDDDIFGYIKAGLNPLADSSFFDTARRYLCLGANSYYFIMLILCAICTISLMKCRDIPAAITLLLIPLGVMAVHLLAEVHGRYHYPVISIFALLAGYGAQKTICFLNVRCRIPGKAQDYKFASPDVKDKT